MPISLIPIATWLLLVAFLLANAIRGKGPFRRAAVSVVTCVSAVLLYNFVPGGVMWARAFLGDAAQQFEYARWKETHIDRINKILLWPGTPDVVGGYHWLEKAADQEFPPALYALGVRLKYGEHVPQPANWEGPGGNVFPQPQRGQALIDRAHALGYKEPVNEDIYYWNYFRR